MASNDFASAQYAIWQDRAAKAYARARDCAAHWTTERQAAFWQKRAADAFEFARSYREIAMGDYAIPLD